MDSAWKPEEFESVVLQVKTKSVQKRRGSHGLLQRIWTGGRGYL